MLDHAGGGEARARKDYLRASKSGRREGRLNQKKETHYRLLSRSESLGAAGGFSTRGHAKNTGKGSVRKSSAITVWVREGISKGQFKPNARREKRKGVS